MDRDLVYLIDMDGTLYSGSSPIQYSKEFIDYLNLNNRKFLLVTNCPEKTSADLSKKLSLMNLNVDKKKILTSGKVAAQYLKLNRLNNVFLIGSNALSEEVISAGIKIVDDNPDYVLVGFDRNFTYEKMKKAIRYINQGAKFIITNGDLTIPEGDSLIPHTGSLSAGIEVATGIKPVILGKPEKYMLEAAVNVLDCSYEELCIIGDRLDTDIAMGEKFNISSFLVMTGVTDFSILQHSSIQPTKVFKNLKEIIEYDRE